MQNDTGRRSFLGLNGKLSFSGNLDLILKRPVITVCIVLSITLLFTWQIPKLSFKTSVYDLVIEKLPETERYKEFKALFGSEEIIRVVVKCLDVYEPQTFQKIKTLSDAASGIAGVQRVISLPVIKKTVDLSGSWDLELFAERLAHVELIQRNLVSADRRTTALTLVLADGADPDEIIARVEAAMTPFSDAYQVYQIGMPLVSKALGELTQRDFMRLPPITFALAALVLFCLYRRFWHMVLPLACVSVALIWAFGLMAITGVPLSLLTLIVPVFLIAVGIAYCLHIVSEYQFQVRTAHSPKQAALATFSVMILPTVLAVSTTVLGLGSLMLNRIVAIREFAIFSCLGMFSLLLVLMTLFPALLALIPISRNDTNPRLSGPSGRITDRIIEGIIKLNLNHRRPTLFIIGAAALFCLIGIFQLRVETNPVGFFKPNTEVSRNFHDIYQDLSGSFPVNLVMAIDEVDYFEKPENMAAIERLQTFLLGLEGIDKTVSFADYIKLVNYASNRFEPKYYALPQESFEVRMLINTYKSMLGKDMLVPFMDETFSKANILLLTHMSNSRAFLDLRRKILAHVKENFSKDIQWTVTGFGMAVSASSHQLTSGQIKSLGMTMTVVFLIMFLLFLSFKVGLIAIVPNLFPIVINFGIMGWLGIELSMVTSLIAGVAIGLAVDDTIHYLFRFNREFQKDLNKDRSMAATLRHVGQPVIYTTLTISIGFSILILSGFKPTSVFGIMMVITMISALVGDLILLPSIIYHIELVTLWDLVRLKLGKEPRYGIPMFKGLSKRQVHSILMAGALRKVDEGEILFQKGDLSDTMYAVISGKLDIIDYPSGRENGERRVAGRIRKVINRLSTGDTVGEMGFLRGMARSATVKVSQKGELLRVNWKMIHRLQWLYPLTAHRFFLNLMGILSDRLEHLTQRVADECLQDDLTGLCSQKGLIGFINKLGQYARRYGDELVLCLVKISTNSDSRLKPASNLNDDSADLLIRQFCDTISRDIRECDTLSRIDARTFGLLLTRSSSENALKICQRLEEMVHRKGLKSDGQPLKMKFAVASYDSHIGESGEDLFSRTMAQFQSA
jgi:predicted RND superfamily exporter protein/CRP-like cAMP-binding protein